MERHSSLSTVAQTQVQPSGSDVSKVESDIAQTISLAGTIITLIREPVALFYQSAAKAQELKRSLGYWKEEAIDERGQCRIPVLRLEVFEQYLVGIDGVIPSSLHLKPETISVGGREFKLSWSGWKARVPKDMSCPDLLQAGTACWAYLLFSLNIRPTMSVTSWRPCIDGMISTQNGGIELEVDGSVLCHIINLYSTPLYHRARYEGMSRFPHTKRLPDRRQSMSCEFSFGELAWDSAGNQVHAHFSPGLETEMLSEKQPFGYTSKSLVPGTIMALYLTTLDHYVSDSRFSLPSATSPLLERVDRLITCFQMLQLRQNPKHSQLLLISYDWFEEAARIKRRILARGGGDHSFFHDLVGNNQDTEGPIRDLFLLDNDSFTFIIPGSRHSSNDAEPFWIRQCAEKTLSDYEMEPDGSWKRSLFEMRDFVIKVLSIPRDVIIRPSMNVQLVEFTGSCDLWDKKVLLGAPIT